MGQGTEELEHHLVLDEALLLQLVGHLAHRVPFVDLHHGGKGGLVEGQHIVGPDPAHAGQEGGDAKHKNDIEQHTPAAETLFPAAGRRSPSGWEGATRLPPWPLLDWAGRRPSFRYSS